MEEYLSCPFRFCYEAGQLLLFLILSRKIICVSHLFSNSQVLTLQASNLTSEDLTLTVFAPASFNSPPSVVSLNSSPASPLSPFIGSMDKHSTGVPRLSLGSTESENQRHGDGGPQEQTVSITDVLPRNDLGCTHLWLQSRVPLG